VVDGTPLKTALDEGRYQPPSLWSVVQVVRIIAELLPLKVGLSHENLPASQLPSGCERCTQKLRAALERFNGTQDAQPLEELSCECQRKNALPIL